MPRRTLIPALLLAGLPGLMLAQGALAQAPAPAPVPAQPSAPATAPSPPRSPAAARAQMAVQMLDALKFAPNEAAATALEGRLRAVWQAQATPATTLLLNRGAREMQDHNPGDAIEDIDAALDLQPDLSQAWTLRAGAQFAAGQVNEAIRDIEQALRLEPRNFDALQLLSRIAESRTDWKGAYAAWQKVLDIDPRTAGGQSRLNDLKRHALGDNT